MDRENFYILLELSIDPPENNPEKIEDAIRSMQAKWGRFRNHPTKGIQAKGYIGMIPEIRRVMLDPQLRAEEADAAKEQVQANQTEKFGEIDRHLTVYMSKGYVTEQEITKLAELHKISETVIKDRIEYKEEEKFAEIDNSLSLRMSKGYVTDAEIAKIAKQHSMPESEIKKRVTCPIRKEKEVAPSSVRQLDDAISKVINDNLQIVGKQSLYDFLELPPNTSLALLQKTARKKEIQVLRISKKDAVVTASGMLAGQCVAIFSDEDSRNAYDVTLSRSRLSDLDSDIDVAGIDGKIRAEYFEILVNSAIDYGLDRDEAMAYIRDYCRSKKYVVESPDEIKKDKKKKLIIAAIALVLCLILAGIGSFVYSGMQAKGRYTKAIAKAQAEPDLEKRAGVFSEYLATAKSGKYVTDVQTKLADTKKAITRKTQEQAYAKVEALVREYYEAKDFARALAVYEKHLEEMPMSAFAGKARTGITQMETAYEAYDYSQLEQTVFTDTNDKIQAYVQYLSRHPEGAHAEEVKKGIWDMGEEYFAYLSRAIKQAESQENWEECLALSDQYINIYDNQRAFEMKQARQVFAIRLKDVKTFEELERRADALGTQYVAARQVLVEYIQVNPKTTARALFDAKLQHLAELEELARIDGEKATVRSLLAQAGGRFVEQAPDTVTDTRTNKTWTILDSTRELGQCIDYQTAETYVTSLKTGGFTDWRLPTFDELTKIYKEQPFFPAGSQNSKWFWTKNHYSSYQDGWVKVVEVVTAQNQTTYRKERIDSWECGSVHAVRP